MVFVPLFDTPAEFGARLVKEREKWAGHIRRLGIKGDYEPTPSWTALFGPGRLPAALARRLHNETVAAVSTPEARAKLQELGFNLMLSASPEDFAARLKRDLDLIAQVFKAAKIEME